MKRALALCGVLVVAFGLAGCLGAGGPLGQADTPLKKWGVAQEAQTAAVTATADALQAGAIDLARAKDLRASLTWSQEALDFAYEEIRKGGEADSVLPLIQRALTKINAVLAETGGGP